MRAETVRCLHRLNSKADIDWLPDRTEKRWAKSMLKWTSSIVSGMNGGSTSRVSSAIRISTASKLHKHIHRGHVSINKEVGLHPENLQGSLGLHF
jgi:hypothetical protein